MDADEAKKGAQYFGRLGAVRREIVQLRCAVCGDQTYGTKKRRYCSRTCQQRAYIDRLRAH